MGETKTFVEYKSSWRAFETSEKISFVEHDLIVDDTEVLINVNAKPSDKYGKFSLWQTAMKRAW